MGFGKLGFKCINRLHLATVVWVFGMTGCPEEDTPDDNTPDEKPSSGSGGDYDPCAEMTSEPVGWDAESALGVSPAEAFSGLEEPCSSTLVWDASGFDTHTVTPVTGESAVTASVALDRSSARLKEGIHPACESVYLEADGTAAIETADGTFLAYGEIAVAYSSKWGVSDFAFGSSLASHEGGFTVSLSENENGRLGFSVDGSMESCVGEVSLWIEESMTNGVSSGGGGPIGGWSNTGCPLDAAPLDISAADEGERSIAEQVEETWGDVTYPAEWDDGQETTLTIQTAVTDTTGCIESWGEALFPAEIRYFTADGRLSDRTAQETLSVAISDDEGVFVSSGVSIDDERVCADDTDDIGYALGSCATLRSITVQLHMDHDLDGRMDMSDEGLTVYEYDRESDADPGAADRVRRLHISL